MSTFKKADHRLVQPREEHYQELDGVKYLLGSYSLDQRARFVESHIELYLVRHPDRTHAQAKRSSYQKWRNLVFATIGDEYVPVTDAKQAKDVVKVFSKPTLLTEPGVDLVNEMVKGTE